MHAASMLMITTRVGDELYMGQKSALGVLVGTGEKSRLVLIFVEGKLSVVALVI